MKVIRRIFPLLLVICIALSSVSIVNAFTLNSRKIYTPKAFSYHMNFGSTTVSQFSAALSQWNSAANRNIMSLSGSTHANTDYPKLDDVNRIYRLNVGNTYLGECQPWSLSTNYMFKALYEADININVYHDFANSAQANKYDVATVFIHEAGHAAGLDHTSTINQVMYPYGGTNFQLITLGSDDRGGMTYKYITNN